MVGEEGMKEKLWTEKYPYIAYFLIILETELLIIFSIFFLLPFIKK